MHGLWSRLLALFFEEYAGTLLYNPSGSGHQHVTVNKSQEHNTGTLLNSGSVLVVIMCTREKKSGAPKCPQDKRTVACSTDLRIKKLVHVAILFSG